MTNFIEADHYSQVPPEAWPWKSFTPEEIACRGTGKIRISKIAMNNLQRLRDALGAPMIINSAYRSPEHNVRVGGAKNSYHVQGLAFDVSMANHDPEVFERAALANGFTGLGFYPPKKGGFIHIDIGPRRTWGSRWKGPKFDAEPKDKTPKRIAGAVGLTGLATSAVEAVKPETLAEIQHTVQPWAAAAPIFQTIFAACGVGIVGWMIWTKFIKGAP